MLPIINYWVIDSLEVFIVSYILSISSSSNLSMIELTAIDLKFQIRPEYRIIIEGLSDNGDIISETY